ncbi:MAG: hypothetical protein O3C21_18410 [Verrucomicrobia bacterium]|nr:hypothetical protein [Verrucomicrobiota bacterium]
MIENLKQQLANSRPWEVALCPTTNGFPPEMISANDPEAEQIFRCLVYYWEINVLLDKWQKDNSESRQAELVTLLDQKRALDASLLPYGVYTEPSLQDGLIEDVRYTSPRAWNPEKRYLVTRLIPI